MEHEKKEEALQELTKKVSENINFDLVDQALQNNEILFEHAGNTYRIRKPLYSDKQKVYKEKITKFTQLLKNPEMILEEDLKTQYKQRGIDIDDMQRQIIDLELEKQKHQLKLGEILAGNGVEANMEPYKDQIRDIEMKQTEISVRKNVLMEFCIESQLLVYLYSFMTTLIAEKQVAEDKWERIWNSFDEFEKCPDEEFVNKAAFHATLILRDEIKF